MTAQAASTSRGWGSGFGGQPKNGEGGRQVRAGRYGSVQMRSNGGSLLVSVAGDDG